jgi:hypothetical protein
MEWIWTRKDTCVEYDAPFPLAKSSLPSRLHNAKYSSITEIAITVVATLNLSLAACWWARFSLPCKIQLLKFYLDSFVIWAEMNIFTDAFWKLSETFSVLRNTLSLQCCEMLMYAINMLTHAPDSRPMPSKCWQVDQKSWHMLPFWALRSKNCRFSDVKTIFPILLDSFFSCSNGTGKHVLGLEILYA